MLAIYTPTAAMKVSNHGTIVGNVALSDQDDRFLGVHGLLDGVLSGGAGHDVLRSGWGDDQVLGDDGRDTLYGNAGDDILSGGAGADLIFGNDGDDFINGGFGYDRINGGAGADTFFHQGLAGHGSDWIQDYSAAEGDQLMAGLWQAEAGDFALRLAHTPGAGAADVDEAFVVHLPTGQILFALVDGAAQESITLRLTDGTVLDLMG